MQLISRTRRSQASPATPPPVRRTDPRAALVVIAALPFALACRSVAPAFGPTPAAAQANADAFFGSLTARFTSVQRDQRFSAARTKLAKHALSPSKLFDDAEVWTSTTADGARQLALEGTFDGSRYLLAAQPAPRAPSRFADSRHVIRLRRLGEDEFEWQTNVDNGVGSIRAVDLANVFGALLAAPGGRAERELREDYRAAFPRTARALGRMLSLDTLRTVPLADGSTAVTLGARVQSDTLRRVYPNYAKFVDKYVQRGKVRIVLRDRRETPWLDFDARNGFIRIRLRTHQGRLLPLTGPAQPMPDSMQVRFDVSQRFLLFDVGASNLVADFAFVRGEHDRAWALRFQREPDWHLPLAVAHLIRSPLRRPFEKGGMLVRVGISDSELPQSVLYRRFTLAVKESAIVRWLGGLGFSAMSDFAGQAEIEENRFNAEVFAGLRGDIVALTRRSSTDDR